MSRNPAKPQPAKPERDAATGTASLMPMEIHVGDRLTEGGHEWEVVTRPAHMHGGKTVRARVVRPGLPEMEREVTWAAHERVAIRRDSSPADGKA